MNIFVLRLNPSNPSNSFASLFCEYKRELKYICFRINVTVLQLLKTHIAYALFVLGKIPI